MNGVPREVPKAKPEGPHAPRVLAFGTSKEGLFGSLLDWAQWGLLSTFEHFRALEIRIP